MSTLRPPARPLRRASCCCPSADRRSPRTSCRSCAPSPPARASLTPGWRRSAQHYYGFGGRSPINDQNRALIAALRAELDRREIDTPVIWGNRNFTPFTHEALREASRARAAPARHRGDQRVLLLLLVPPVPRGPGRRTGRARRAWPRRRARQGPPLRRPPRLLAGQQPAGHRGRARRAARRGAPRPASDCCSSPTRSPPRWTTPPDPATTRATPTRASTSRSPPRSPARSTRPSTPT